MALQIPIETLLKGNIVESPRIEFKESWDPEASLKTICAFANDFDNWGGGYIVIGVTDKTHELVGVAPEKIDRYQREILQSCHLIQPDYMPIISPEIYEGKLFLVVWASGGDTRPYSSPAHIYKDSKKNKKRSPRIYWIRKASSTVQPTPDQLRDLFTLANRVPFDDRVNQEAEISDLNLTLIKSFLRETGSALYAAADTIDFVDLCADMQIISNQPGYRKPKNVGLMFFSMEPDRFFPYAQIDVVALDDTGSLLQERTFRGPLHQQLRDALQHIRNVFLTEYVIKDDQKAEARRFFNYPYAAVEEALSNAVYHKGYDEREPIEVRIESDRMIIVSHPGADIAITQDDLRQFRAHNRRYRNRRIGDFLKELHLTEGRNTGFRKIRSALEQNGSPPPLFETDEERTFFTTTLLIHPEASNTSEQAVDVPTPATPDTSLSFSLTENECRLLDYVRDNPTATIGQVAGALNMPQRTLIRTTKVLEGKGALRKEGPNRKRIWRVLVGTSVDADA
ncbi:MAG: AAA family ATPase [Clostridia bacterium]|nr:AAA family ATPase [Clostridia bacterium]